MAKIPVKKTAAKKSAAKKTEKSKTASKEVGAKKTVSKKSGVLKLSSSKYTRPTGRIVAKKGPVGEKERELREANMLANLENKKKPASKKRKKTSSPKETASLLDTIVEGMQERKAKNISILNLSNIENRVTDYFVVCDADSNTHVNSIADSVEDTVIKHTDEKAYHIEGRQNGEWILIDYINIVVHIFLREAREHYNIEGLWGDAEITNIKD